MTYQLNPSCPHCRFLEACFAQYQADFFRQTFEYLHKGTVCNYEPGIVFQATIKGADNVIAVCDEINKKIAMLQSALNGITIGVDGIEEN